MELYKKVIIKSEADRPKEDGNYICHHEGMPNTALDVFPFKVNESHWFTHIDWYLQPIEQPEIQFPTDEEIEDFALKTNHGNTVMGAKWMKEQVIKRNSF